MVKTVSPATLSMKTIKVTNAAILRVKAVAAEALALGWTEPELFSTSGKHRFPCSAEYGLVCFVKDTDEVQIVTRESITIGDPNDKGGWRTLYKRRPA